LQVVEKNAAYPTQSADREVIIWFGSILSFGVT